MIRKNQLKQLKIFNHNYQERKKAQVRLIRLGPLTRFEHASSVKEFKEFI